MKKTQNVYMPYNFDFKYEYKTYINIGKEYKIQYITNSNLISRIYKLIRAFLNKGERRYRNFNCFLEWEQYVKEKVEVDAFGIANNLKNFEKFLNKEKRENENIKSNLGSIVTPMYISLLGGFITFMASENNMSYKKTVYMWIFYSILVITVMVLLLKWSISRNRKYNFYKDYIEIIEGREKEISESSH